MAARGGGFRPSAPAPRLTLDARPEALRQRLLALGFDDVRFAAATPPAAAGLRDWLAAGRHADMAWMERTAEKRLDPGLVLAGTRSVIMLGVNYWPGQRRANGPAWSSEEAKATRP